jgi:phosphoribosylformylglycinamidine cyclo-ligase
MNTYKQSGVDVATGDEASQNAKTVSQQTYRAEVTNTGGIPVFDARFSQYTNPVLLGSTDGVGTKLKIAFEMNKHDTVGIDLVAMAVNDLVRYGAEPITFLPYIGIQQINSATVQNIMKGIVEGCKQANCSVVGGETAELRDIYHPGEYDLVGNAHGVVEKESLITGDAIREGDVLVGFPSSGLHSNGYTLARKVLQSEYQLSDKPSELQGKSIGEELLVPTRIYVEEVLSLLSQGTEIHGIAHITGGGIPSKLGNSIPQGLSARVHTDTWQRPPVFDLIQKLGHVSDDEMYHSFNMGIGMVLVLPKQSADRIRTLQKDSRIIGRITKGTEKVLVQS